MYLQRLPPVSEPVLEDPAVTGCTFPRDYPGLFEHLTVGVWPDGKPRPLSTLLICVDGGRFRACLNDRANGCSTWVSAASVAGVLQVLDSGIRQGSLDWRRSTWQGGKRK
jgi:hypothetical protein